MCKLLERARVSVGLYVVVSNSSVMQLCSLSFCIINANFSNRNLRSVKEREGVVCRYRVFQQLERPGRPGLLRFFWKRAGVVPVVIFPAKWSTGLELYC